MKQLLVGMSFLIIGLQAKATEVEICKSIEKQIEVVISYRDPEKIQNVEIYESGLRLVSDSGLQFGWVKNYCHAEGEIQFGKELSLGGCASYPHLPARILRFKDGSRAFNLDEFECSKK